MTRNQWETSERPHVYTLEISETEGAREVPCARCAMPLPLNWFTVTRDRENEIQTWTLRHSCGASMIIFND